MDWNDVHLSLAFIQHCVSTAGVLIIVLGVLTALIQCFYYAITKQLLDPLNKINHVRLSLGKILILGLEFIVAADLIGTTTTPDYYAVGILAIIVAIRTLLSFSLNRELMNISKEQ